MDNYGLVGKTLGYSFSKGFFTDLFERESISATYSNFEISEINSITGVFETNNLNGLNITIPYKEQIIPFLDELSPEATAIGAVNVVAFKNGLKIGHNTDAFGFQQSIKPFLTNQHERALIIGTGGASKAIAYVFEQLGIDVVWISRKPKNASQFSYEDVNEHMINACKVIVHCTPVGTFPNVEECIDFPFEQLTNQHLVIDLIYNPEETKFLRKSKENDATTLNGLSMLREQALKAWGIWNER